MTERTQTKRKSMGRPRVFGKREALTIRIDSASAQALRELAGEQGMPITQILAAAVQAVVANRQ
jgi:hypothetical protein